MTRTHRGIFGVDAGGSCARGNGDGDLPPPPHPTPAEMMAQLMETQCSMGEVLHGLPLFVKKVLAGPLTSSSPNS